MTTRRPRGGLLAAGLVLVALTWVGADAPAARLRGPVLPRDGGPAPASTEVGLAAGATEEPPAPEAGDRPGDVLVIPYTVEVTSPDPTLADAPAEIAAVLEDPRGWQQAGIDFRADPDAPYTIALVEGDEAQALCQPYDVGGQFSCQNGPLVVLNAIRWREGVPHWPGDLGSYRTMLVNHEVGHLLGMHHLRCQVPGTVAPVMEQQSGTLRGCQANPWPTPIELRLAATHQFRIAPPPLDVPFPQ